MQPPTPSSARNGNSSVAQRINSAVEESHGKFALGIIALTNLDDLISRYGEGARSLIAESFRGRIGAMLRPEDHMIVIAEDQICIIVDELLDNHHLQLAGIKLARVFDIPTDVAGQSIDMQVSAGLVYAGRRTKMSKSPEALYQLAEETCVCAVTDRHTYLLVNAAEDKPEDHDWQLNQRIVSAMENHHISLDYQPKIVLADGSLAGGEALVRWRDNGAIVPPDEYIAALDDDLLWQLTIYIYRRVLREILDFELEKPISVNIDPSSLTRSDFVDFICRETNLWGVPPEQLVFEITESRAIFDISQSRAILERMRNAGFGVSLDDFGAGHSNMRRIRDLPLSELKLDRSICGNILTNQDSAHITQTVLSLANTLNIDCVGEGIEDAETLEQLRQWECTFGQGFYLSSPLAIEDFAELHHNT